MKGNEQDIVLTAMKKFPTQFIKGIKKELYDARKKEWTTCHITSADVHMKELDAADDEKICNALASAHKGNFIS